MLLQSSGQCNPEGQGRVVGKSRGEGLKSQGASGELIPLSEPHFLPLKIRTMIISPLLGLPGGLHEIALKQHSALSLEQELNSVTNSCIFSQPYTLRMTDVIINIIITSMA